MNRLESMALIIDKTSAPTSAPAKPVTLSGVSTATKLILIALTINKNSPKLIIVNGKVKIVIIGLKTAFTKPKIRAAIKIEKTLGLSKYKPTPSNVVRYKASELSSNLFKKFILIL